MSSNPNSTSQRRSLRQSNNPLKKVQPRQFNSSVLNASDTAEKVKTKKRKSEVELRSDANQRTSAGMKTSLEDAGVSVGVKTTRDRLLELLERHVKPKRPRLRGARRRIPSKNDVQEKTTRSPSSTQINVVESVDFSIYHVSHLVDMLENIGMDTSGLDKEALIQTCKSHSEMLILPGFSVSVPRPDSVIAQQEGVPLRTIDPDTEFPSLERGRSAFPHPHPTVLDPIVASKHRKGKGKAIPEEDEDWIPEERPLSPNSEVEERVNNQSTTKPTKAFDSTKQSGSNTTHSNNTQPRPSSKEDADHNKADHNPNLDLNLNSELIQTIARLNARLTKTDKKVEAMESELRTLAGLIKKMMEKRDGSKESESKGGGRTASRVRFHIACMLGPNAQQKLPKPASAEEKNGWLSEQSIDSIQFDLESDPHTLDAQQASSNSPQNDGPGHPDSSPQQISVIRLMMKAAGVRSFRPDFSRSVSFGNNKWLWDLSMKIFIKLVECGEYTGIASTTRGINLIKKSFTSHIQTLQKRYREENWDVARKKKAADEVRRSTRMRHLKASRDRVVLSKECFWPLSGIMQAACSDDETDDDGDEAISDALRANKPCNVRRLAWRSDALEAVCLLIDKYKSNLDSSIPGYSPGQKGRPPRRRIRGTERPISRIEAPAGLPIDCYSEDWVSSLSAVQRCQLEIHSSPVLEPMISLLESCT
ncbi:hypothetical protein DFH28DRAFT_1133925 [Melampsora americana]|nr:hypothetical protein DFH28DRAFT_1133925 [Melampsora americana]